MDRKKRTVYLFSCRCLVGICMLLFLHIPINLPAQEYYSIKFSFSAEDSKGGMVYTQIGDVLVCGGKYRLGMPDELLVVCDGKTQWIYNYMNDDIMISNSEISEHLSKAATPFDAIETLIFASIGAGNGKIETKKDNSGNPVEIILHSNKSIYKIKVNSVEVKEGIDKEKFILNVKEYPKAVVTDLR